MAPCTRAHYLQKLQLPEGWAAVQHFMMVLGMSAALSSFFESSVEPTACQMHELLAVALLLHAESDLPPAYA